MINKINKAISELFTDISMYVNEAPQNATYPYAVITSQRLNINDGISTWSVDIDVWDKHKYYSRAEAQMDAIEKELDFKRIKMDNNLLCLFKSQRNEILDSDTAIKRVKAQFEMIVYESEA